MRVTGWLVTVAVVRAASADPEQARSPFEQGRELLAAGKAAEACEKFEAALAIDNEAFGALLNLGLCNEQLGKVATALRWFRKAQTRASELGNRDYEAAAKDKTSALVARVPTLRVVLTRPAPAGTFVEIDGTRVEPADYQRVELDAGKHVVELHGATLPSETIDLHDGDHQTVKILVPAPEKQTRIVEVDNGRKRRRAAYLLGVASVGLYGGTLVLGVVGKVAYDAADRPSRYGPWHDAVAYGGTSMFVLATGAAAAAIYLYVSAPKAHRIEVPIAPVVGPGRVGAVIEGSF